MEHMPDRLDHADMVSTAWAPLPAEALLMGYRVKVFVVTDPRSLERALHDWFSTNQAIAITSVCQTQTPTEVIVTIIYTEQSGHPLERAWRAIQENPDIRAIFEEVIRQPRGGDRTQI